MFHVILYIAELDHYHDVRIKIKNCFVKVLKEKRQNDGIFQYFYLLTFF